MQIIIPFALAPDGIKFATNSRHSLSSSLDQRLDKHSKTHTQLERIVIGLPSAEANRTQQLCNFNLVNKVRVLTRIMQCIIHVSCVCVCSFISPFNTLLGKNFFDRMRRLYEFLYVLCVRSAMSLAYRAPQHTLRANIGARKQTSWQASKRASERANERALANLLAKIALTNVYVASQK